MNNIKPSELRNISLAFNFKQATGNELLDALDLIISQLNSQSDEVAVRAITETFANLPLPPAKSSAYSLENPWCQLSIDNRKKCLKQLNFLSKRYLASIRGLEKSNKDYELSINHNQALLMLNMYRALACSYGLAAINDHESGENNRIKGLFTQHQNPPDGLYKLKENKFLHSFDPRYEAKMNELCAFFDATAEDVGAMEGDKGIFHLNSIFYSGKIAIPENLNAFRNTSVYRYFVSIPIEEREAQEIKNAYYNFSNVFEFNDLKALYLANHSNRYLEDFHDVKKNLLYAHALGREKLSGDLNLILSVPNTTKTIHTNLSITGKKIIS